MGKATFFFSVCFIHYQGTDTYPGSLANIGVDGSYLIGTTYFEKFASHKLTPLQHNTLKIQLKEHTPSGYSPYETQFGTEQTK